MSINVKEIIKRVIRYLVEGGAVACASAILPKKALKMDEILMIALVAAATFSILDTYIPSMGASARNGAGLGIGFNLVGWPMGV
jgi:hypothetical protein